MNKLELVEVLQGEAGITKRNINPMPAEIQKPAKLLMLSQRNYHFLNVAKN